MKLLFSKPKALLAFLLIFMINSYFFIEKLADYGAPLNNVMSTIDFDIAFAFLVATLLPTLFYFIIFTSIPQIPFQIMLTSRGILFKSFIMRNFVFINGNDIQEYRSRFWGISITAKNKCNRLILLLYSKRDKQTVLDKLSEFK